MKIVCVANFGSQNLDFGRFIDSLSLQSGVLRRDFPESWDSRQNLVWYEGDPRHIDGEEIKRRAARQWGDTLLREHSTIVEFARTGGLVGKVGFFQLPPDIENRKLLLFNPVRFRWIIHSKDFANKRSEVIEGIKQLPWYKSTRFINPSGNTDTFKHIEASDESVALLVELYEELEVRSIEKTMEQLFAKHELEFAQIVPVTCPKCNGVIELAYGQCLACARRARLERAAQEVKERQEREHRDTEERQKKAERRAQKECIICGRKLGLFNRLRRVEKHRNCT
jgi:hypothetical protein